MIIPRFRKDKKVSPFIKFQSTGHPSDRFLHLLAGLYKQSIDSNAKFTASISAAFVNLQDFANHLNDSTGSSYLTPAQYKLFFDAENEEGDDAELFLDINPADAWVELGEKDGDYRPKLIQLFKQR